MSFEKYTRDYPPEQVAALADFLLARGVALDRYSSVEQELMMLFRALVGIRASAAATIMVNIHNVSSQWKIMESLVKFTPGSKYPLFFRSLKKAGNALANKRNQIVHWQPVTRMHADLSYSYGLGKPNFWETAAADIITVGDIDAFSAHAEKFMKAIWIFNQLLDGDASHIGRDHSFELS